jgi:hypothetical protein
MTTNLTYYPSLFTPEKKYNWIIFEKMMSSKMYISVMTGMISKLKMTEERWQTYKAKYANHVSIKNVYHLLWILLAWG